MTVAYFSMEFALHEEFPSYSGGLGVLAGDFLKGAHDLGLPLVGVGLRWAEGYTAQRLDPAAELVDEWHEHRPDFLDDTGVRVRVRVAGRGVECRVWRVGRYAIVPLYLLEPTDSRDHWITRRLYDPRPDCRIAQEMLLGIGGARALRLLHPEVRTFHFNEGHAVFAGIELIAAEMEGGASFEAAWRAARARIVFTTHTPVPAGNEIHPLADILRLGAGCELVAAELRQLGGDPFNMTAAGLRLARRANAVSELHSRTARTMWADVRDAAPIIGITNGVHVPTWQDPRVPGDLASDDALETLRRALKADLVAEIERRTGVRLAADVLTVAVARRAATYKRPDLVLRDLDRVGRLLKGQAAPAGLRRQGAPRRPRGQGHGDASRADDPAVAGRSGVPRELRHGARPAPHAWGRRVAEHPAPAARGQRHVGHEGRAQRGPALLDARRLVARGMRARRDRMGDRRRSRG